MRKQHLQAYLNEFVFRFNRRFYRSILFQKLLGLGAGAAAPIIHLRKIYSASTGPRIPTVLV
ncbi:MAG: hypothetical protein EXR74_01270 [Bdellovibrionales bacterium]|nr:hypothetical protein [Bdellovibrionales bacterium]